MTVNGLMKNLNAGTLKALALGLALFLGGCSVFGGGDDKGARVEAAEEVFQIGVNAYLWRATLETLSFMPMRSTDHEGGVVVTDWTTHPTNANERTKVDVLILGRKLTADALKVTVHRQMQTDGQWQDVNPRPGADIRIRDAILMQARLLRRNNAPIK